jgi:hypothetical protein
MDTAKRARACEEKQTFLTLDEAKRTLHHIRKASGRKYSTYRCPFCRLFHLTGTETRKVKGKTKHFKV